MYKAEDQMIICFAKLKNSFLFCKKGENNYEL